MKRRVVAAALMLALAAIPAAHADESLWALLKGGGQVVLMRHAVTTPGVGDPEGMRLADCATQRNLSDEGRAHAKQVGEAFRARKIPVGQVLSSPWCRCLETARLAFGIEPQASPARRPRPRAPRFVMLARAAHCVAPRGFRLKDEGGGVKPKQGGPAMRTSFDGFLPVRFRQTPVALAIVMA